MAEVPGSLTSEIGHFNLIRLEPFIHADQLNVHVNHLKSAIKEKLEKRHYPINRGEGMQEAKFSFVVVNEGAEIVFAPGFTGPTHFFTGLK